jgi:hypothetical protein
MPGPCLELRLTEMIDTESEGILVAFWHINLEVLTGLLGPLI